MKRAELELSSVGTPLRLLPSTDFNIYQDHMCKPNMQLQGQDMAPVSEAVEFDGWKNRMTKLASFSNTYVKISGGFSEIVPLPKMQQQIVMDFWSRARMLQSTQNWIEQWLNETLLIFGPKRIMFGSDWPICNVGGGGNEIAWMNWWWIVEHFVQSRISEEHRADFWSGNAIKVYGGESLEPSTKCHSLDI